MNLRLFTFAMLVSAVPLSVLVGSKRISFHRGDFASAKQVDRDGETLIDIRLSKSGKAKLKKIKESANGEFYPEFAGVPSELALKDFIKGNGLELGPFSEDEAKGVLNAINKN